MERFGARLAQRALGLFELRGGFRKRARPRAGFTGRARREEATGDAAQIDLGVALETHDGARFGERGVAALRGGLGNSRDREPRDPRCDRVAQWAHALLLDFAKAALARDVTMRVPIDVRSERAEIGHGGGHVTVGAIELHQP